MASFPKVFQQGTFADEREKFISEEIDDVNLCDVNVGNGSSDVFTGTGNSEVSRPLHNRKPPKKEKWNPEIRILISVNIACFCGVVLALFFSFVLWGEIRDLQGQQSLLRSQIEECMNDNNRLLDKQGDFERGELVPLRENVKFNQWNDNEPLQGVEEMILQEIGEKETIDMKAEFIQGDVQVLEDGHPSRQKRSPPKNRNNRRNGRNRNNNEGGKRKKNRNRKNKLTTAPPDSNLKDRTPFRVSAIHLEGDSHTVFVGKKFEDWNVSEQPAVDTKVFSYHSGEVTIQTDGVYFLYSQVTYFTQFPSVAHTVNKKGPGQSDTSATVIMKCLSNIDRSEGGGNRYSSCYTGRAVYLQVGDSIFISDHHGQADSELVRTVDFSPEKTYWGLVQLSDTSV